MKDKFLRKSHNAPSSKADEHKIKKRLNLQILKKFFIIAGWFWTGKRSLGAWAMLAVTLGASLAIVKVATLMNAWDKKFYDAIEKFQKDLMLPLVGEFLVYTAVIVLLRA